MKAFQNPIFLPVKTHELPINGETGGFDQDLFDFPIGTEPSICEKQDHHRLAESAIDHHDVAHGFRFVVVLVVEHTHPPFKPAGLRKGIIPHVIHGHSAKLAALGPKRP